MARSFLPSIIGHLTLPNLPNLKCPVSGVHSKLLSILLKGLTRSLQEKSGSDEIIEQLKQINERLESLEKTLSFRFRLTVGIAFIGLALGATYASLEYQWLSLVLLVGGMTLICWARVDYSGYTHARLANFGFVLTIIGLISAVIYLLCQTTVRPIFFFIGLILILIGFALMTEASRQTTPNRQR
jgi:hypothetical protein